MTSQTDERCKCSFAIRMTGEGCRYCQPQNYIDHLKEDNDRIKRQVEVMREGLEKIAKRPDLPNPDRDAALPQQPSLPQGMTERVKQLCRGITAPWTGDPEEPSWSVMQDEAAAILKALSALPGNSVKGVEWQPIETAPKDGRSVLIFYKNSLGKTRIIRAAYTQKFTEENDNDWAEYSEEKDCYYSPEGWYEQMEHWDEYGSCFVSTDSVARFTHWMPLPKPPASTDTAKGEE